MPRACVLESGGCQEEIHFVIAPQRIEIAGDNHWFRDGLEQGVQIAELAVTMTELEGKVNQENREVRKFQFHDEALDALSEIVKSACVRAVPRETRINVLIE